MSSVEISNRVVSGIASNLVRSCLVTAILLMGCGGGVAPDSPDYVGCIVEGVTGSSEKALMAPADVPEQECISIEGNPQYLRRTTSGSVTVDPTVRPK